MITYYATRESLVSSVRVEEIGAHDHVTIWNRGAHTGLPLIFARGDGIKLVNVLIPEPTSVEQS